MPKLPVRPEAFWNYLDGLLVDAYLYRTDLRGVDLTKTIGLSQNQLRNSCGDNETKLPEGLELV